MSDEKQIKNIAEAVLQEVTGTPSRSLRGLTADDSLAEFKSRLESRAPDVASPPTMDVKSTIQRFPETTIKTNETNALPGDVGGIGTTNLQVIIAVSGVLKYYNIYAEYVGDV